MITIKTILTNQGHKYTRATCTCGRAFSYPTDVVRAYEHVADEINDPIGEHAEEILDAAIAAFEATLPPVTSIVLGAR